MVDKESVDVQETQKMYVISMPEGILNVVLKLVNETPMARMVSDALLKDLYKIVSNLLEYKYTYSESIDVVTYQVSLILSRMHMWPRWAYFKLQKVILATLQLI